ncbi:hypothetical protein GUJ93_ZPchr0004g39613 [Zizania palustris]|uniref:Uncharacterized protein n=1 Tax=Zizania palustris TaxID=103762 RepID=A0A8J5V8T5_ZIZPA|nr:hypothetical protein GUJ93_ZPchr0004g39613 [Zizania palustris]
MSPPTSLKDSRINWSEPVPSTANFRTVEERVSGSSIQETKLTPLARVGEQLSEKPFCCTCRESISMESQLHHQSATPRSMPIFTGRQVPQLNIDYMSPSLQTQLPSPSNPILRLMGKNLMVMNSEESGHPQAPSSDYIMGGNYMQPVSFVPQNYQHNGDSAFMNTTTSTANHQIPQSSVQGGNFVGPHCPVVPWCNLITISTKALQKPCSSNASLILLDERSIMINDSPEHRSNPQFPSEIAGSVPVTNAAKRKSLQSVVATRKGHRKGTAAACSSLQLSPLLCTASCLANASTTTNAITRIPLSGKSSSPLRFTWLASSHSSANRLRESRPGEPSLHAPGGSVGSNRHQIMSMSYDGDQSEDRQSEEVQSSYKSHGGSVEDSNPLVESMSSLQTTQETLEREMHKLSELSKELGVEDFVSPNEDGVLEINQKMSHLKQKLDEASNAIKEKDSRLSELLPTLEKGGVKIDQLEMDLDRQLQEKIEAEIQSLVMLKARQSWLVRTEDQIALKEHKLSAGGDDTIMVLKLRDTESKIMKLKELVDKLEVHERELLGTTQVLKMQSRIFKICLFGLVQLILLCISLKAFFTQASAPFDDVVPT